MILDDNLILVEDGDISETITSDPIALTSFQAPGRTDHIPMAVLITEEAAGGTSVTLTLQQAEEEDGDYSDVSGSEMTVALDDMEQGKNIGWRCIPAGVTEPWIRIVIVPSGTFTSGKIFAAVVREEILPYVEGMYIDAGVVKG